MDGAVDFDGTDDTVVATDIDLPSSFTLSVWMKADVIPGAGVWRNLVTRVSGSSSNGDYYLELSGDEIEFGFLNTVNGIISSTSANLVAGRWYHIAGVFSDSANTLAIYVNGSLSISAAETNSPTTNNDIVEIGAGWPGENFDGRIDDVRIYNRALSAADVAALVPYDCVYPFAVTSNILYNADWRTPQYCNGAQWIDMGIKKYVPKAVTFDGADDYLTRGADLTGNADAKTATGSFWFRRNGGTGTAQAIWSNTSARFQISFSTGNLLRLLGTTTAPATTLDISGSSAITDTSWHHAMFTFDLTDSTKRYIYIDGVAETIAATT